MLREETKYGQAEYTGRSGSYGTKCNQSERIIAMKDDQQRYG